MIDRARERSLRRQRGQDGREREENLEGNVPDASRSEAFEQCREMRRARESLVLRMVEREDRRDLIKNLDKTVGYETGPVASFENDR